MAGIQRAITTGAITFADENLAPIGPQDEFGHLKKGKGVRSQGGVSYRNTSS